MQETINLDEKKSKSKSINYGKWGLIFIIPFFVAYLIFTLIPQLLTIGYSFFNYYVEGFNVTGPEFVGFDNYVAIFTPDDEGVISIFKYMGNTLLLWVIGAVPQFIVALLLAVLFTSARLNLKCQAFFKSVFYMPNLIMASAFALLVTQVFSNSNYGPVNSILLKLGWIDEAYKFLEMEISVKSLIALMNFVMWFGNTTIVLMAGIQGIDESVFESARMDGASSLMIFKDITMPLLKPIFIYVFITSMIGGIQMFDVPEVLTNGNGTPDKTSRTMVMYLNSLLKGNSKNYGLAGAVSVVLFIVTVVLSLIVFKTMAKDDEK